MTRWFRFYGDAINNPKVLRLSDAMFRAWVTLLCIASQYEGILPAAADIALILRMKVHKVAEWLTVLTTAGLLDCLEDGTFRPHNWNERQFQSDVSSERVKRFRERKRNVSSTVSETPPDTEQKQITETEQKTISRAEALEDDWPDDFGDVFWQAYPRKTEKLEAMKRLSKVRKSGLVTFTELLAGVHRYAKAVSTNDPQFTKHPSVWLNKGCWADETLPGANNGNGNFNGARRSSGADFFAGLASVAADIAGNDPASRSTEPEIPLGRHNIDG